jgi:hypothetical protein
VLAVLERTQAAPISLRLDPDVQLQAAGGTLTLKATGGMRFESSRAIDLLANTLNVVAERGSVLVHSLSLLSECLRLDTGRASLVATAIETFAERISTRAGRVTRHIAGLEQVQAAEFQLRVDNTLELRGQNALFSAKQLFKLNGEQVHVG